MTIQPGENIGPYEVKERLGEGGMAAVYKAWHGGLHRHEALKIPRGGNSDPSYVQRLLAEARLAAGLRHPHIVAIHNVSEPSAPIPFFAMEWIEGQDLLAWLKERGRLSLDETIQLLEPVASALDYAHSKGVIHRDIKPANILLQNNPGLPSTPKVVDFGISRAADDDDGATRLTRSGMFVGTPEYMSPEQSGSGEEVGHATDIYSFGVLAYEMLCGAPPFTAGSGVSRLAILVQHVRDTPSSPCARCSGLPEEVGEIILRALAKSQTERYNSCSEFIADLRAAAATAAPTLEPAWDEAGSTIMIPAPMVGGLLTTPPVSAPPTNELSPFDATRFGVEDIATIADRPLPQVPPVGTGGTRHNVAAEIQTREHIYSEPTLQIRVPVAELQPRTIPEPTPAFAAAEEAAPNLIDPTPVRQPEPALHPPVARHTRAEEPTRHEKNKARPVFATATLDHKDGKPKPAAGSRTALMAALGGGIIGAVLVLSLIGRMGGGQPESQPGPKAQASAVAGAAISSTAVEPIMKPVVVESAPKTHTKVHRRLEIIPFNKVTRNTDTLPIGTRKVVTSGKSGQREVLLALTLQGDQELSRKVTSRRTVRSPQHEVILQGTMQPRPKVEDNTKGDTPERPRIRSVERPRVRITERPRIRVRNTEPRRPRVRIAEPVARPARRIAKAETPRRAPIIRRARPIAPRRARPMYREAPLPP